MSIARPIDLCSARLSHRERYFMQGVLIGMGG